MKSKILCSLLLFAIPYFLLSQSRLNLDFENKIENSQVLERWNLGGNGYITGLDSIIKYHGKYSVFMESNANPLGRSFCVCSESLPVYLVKGKKIILRGYFKTENVKDGYAGLWLGVSGDKNGEKNKMLGYDDMNKRGLKGTTDWKQISIEMQIDQKAENINFGALFKGTGKVWIDFFEIEIEGKTYNDSNLVIKGPEPDELEWLKSAIIPIRTVDADDKDDDLLSLKEAFTNAKITALGEVSHGSSEIFRMKHRIVKFLREKCKYDIFSIEAIMPEAYLLNDFVLNGTGKPDDLIRGMYFWTWRTQEVLNMVNWMRDNNIKNENKIQFTGFDMQYYAGAISELDKSAVKQNNSEFKSEIDKLKIKLDTLFRKRMKNNGYAQPEREDDILIKKYIQNIKKYISRMDIKKTESDWLYQNVRIIEQFLDKIDRSDRDKYMAENVNWIVQQNPASKIALWAHNGHIQKNSGSMGSLLFDKYKKDYLSVGFTFSKGMYTAYVKDGPSPCKAQEAYLGTYEYFFQSINVPIFALDLRKIPRDNPAANWILHDLEFRTVAALKRPSEFDRTSFTKDFDIIIFINESTNSKLLSDK